jgi:hypothetical protein
MRFELRSNDGQVDIVRTDTGAVVGALYPGLLGGSASEDFLLWTVAAMNKYDRLKDKQP